MSQPFPVPPQPPKRFWTVSKILGLVLVLLVVGSAAGAGIYYGIRPTLNSQCGDGATNYPSCTLCPSGKTLALGSCVNNCTNSATNPPSCNNNVCTNGATNYPTCDSCPAGQTYSGGSCYNNCSNGATNPPTCNVYPPCNNGATNPPQCTLFNSTTSITCTPNTLVSHRLNSTSCHIIVSSSYSPTVPTGSVGFTAAGATAWYANGAPCTLILAAGYAYCDITGVTTDGPSGTMTINAGYGGDSSHAQSTGNFALTVTDPPSTVTVSGTVTNSGGSTPYQIQFVNTATSVGYTAPITGGRYSISIANLAGYNVIQYFSNAFGTGQCSMGTLNLQSPTSTWTADFSC